MIPRTLFIWLRARNVACNTLVLQQLTSELDFAMVTKKKTCEVAVHFNKTPHDLSDFSFQCINQVQETVNNSCSIEKLLITKEAYWSAQLFSLAPFGLNRRQEFHSKKRINYN